MLANADSPVLFCILVSPAAPVQLIQLSPIVGINPVFLIHLNVWNVQPVQNVNRSVMDGASITISISITYHKQHASLVHVLIHRTMRAQDPHVFIMLWMLKNMNVKSNVSWFPLILGLLLVRPVLWKIFLINVKVFMAPHVGIVGHQFYKCWQTVHLFPKVQEGQLNVSTRLLKPDVWSVSVLSSATCHLLMISAYLV